MRKPLGKILRMLSLAALVLGFGGKAAQAAGVTSVTTSYVSSGTIVFTWSQESVSTATVRLSTNNYLTINSSQTLGANINSINYTLGPSTSIVPNTTYYFEVRLATEADGNYVTFTTATPSVTPAVLPAATGLTFGVPPNISSMTVSFASGTLAGGYNPLSVTTYTVTFSTSPAYASTHGNNVTLSSMPGGVLPTATIVNGAGGVSGTLIPNTTYFLYIQALNVASTGNSPVSGALASTATLAAQATSIPATAGTAVPLSVSTGHVNVQWASGTLAGGYNPLGVTTYTVVLSTQPSIFTVTDAGNVSVSTMPGGTVAQGEVRGGGTGVTGTVLPNTTYYAYVYAQNRNGVLAVSAQVASTMTTGALTTTLPVDAGSGFPGTPASASLIVSFASGTLLGGYNPLNVTSYKLIASTSGTLAVTDAGNVVFASTKPAGAVPTATITNAATNVTGTLLPNTTYFVYAAPLNAAGAQNGNFALVGSTSTLGSTPSPLHVSAGLAFPASVSTMSITVSWATGTLSGLYNRLNVTTYTITFSTAPSYVATHAGNVTLSSAPTGALPMATVSHGVAGLTGAFQANTTYYAFVAAMNFNSYLSSFSLVGTTSTLANPPAPLIATSLISTFSVVGSTASTISWSTGTPSAGYNPLNITTYSIVMSTSSSYAVGNSSNVVYSSAPAGATPTATFGTLTPNTTYYGFVSAVGTQGSQTAYVQVGTTVTLAAIPSISTTTTAVHTSSIVFVWSANSNPMGTTYYAYLSTDNFTTTIVSTFTQGFTATFGTGGLSPAVALASGINYNLRVRALSGNTSVAATDALGATRGIFTDYATLPSVTTTGSQTAPTAAAQTFTTVDISSLTVAWTASSGANTYRVEISSISDFSTISASSMTANLSVIFGSDTINTGFGSLLESNRIYYAHVQSSGSSGLSQFVTLGSTYTLAKPPAGTLVLVETIFASSATVRWSINGNVMQNLTSVVVRSTSTDFTTTVSSVTKATATVTNSYTDTSLVGCTPYYFKVNNINAFGRASSFDAVTTLFTTLATTPAAPGSLTAVSNTGNTVTLSWSGSATEGITAYNLYADSGTAGVVISTGNTSTFIASISTAASSYTTGALPSSAQILFKLTAKHRCGIEETVGVAATAASTSTLANVRAKVTQPVAGATVGGGANGSSALTVTADLISGSPTNVEKVVFQYQSTATANWTVISTATALPYRVAFNVTGFTALPQQLRLRAVAYDISSTSDSTPGSVSITLVDPTNAILTAQPGYTNETVAGGDPAIAGALVTKTVVVSNGSTATVSASGLATDGTARVSNVSIPGGSFNANVTLTIMPNPTAATLAGVPLPAASGTLSPVVTEITVGGGATFNGLASVTVSYPDANNDGVIDGTTLRADTVKFLSHTGGAGAQWNQDVGTSCDLVNHTCTGTTSHFSFFALAGVIQTTLDLVRVYPVPFKPNSSNADEGRAYSAGNANSGIVFDNLPANATIKIYTVTGQLVTRKDISNGTGALQWDVRNDAGRNVASGGYFAVITSPGLKSVTKRLAIIR